MDRWMGIISGDVRGIVSLDNLVVNQGQATADVTIYQEEVALTAKFKGEINDIELSGNLDTFAPPGDGVSKTGNVNLKFSNDKKELKGSYQTDLAKGEALLYKFPVKPAQQVQKDPIKTLEVKEMGLEFFTFDKKSIDELLNILTRVVTAIRENSDDKTILPPIYDINYDREERIRTYSYDDFKKKFNDANSIWHVGFEFKDERQLTKINFNLWYQPNIAAPLKSGVHVESGDKEIVMMVPEMIRGVCSKVKNSNRWAHRWLFELAIQILGIVTMLAASFFVSKKLAILMPQFNDLRFYSFVTALIIFSNLWAYASRLSFNYFYKVFPVVEIINKPKNRIMPIIVLGAIGSLIASVIYSAIISLISLLK